jgi:peptide/nickel transport system permease protein
MKLFVLGLSFVSVIAAMLILSFISLPHDPYEMSISNRFAAPNVDYWLGTDQYGRDIFSRLIVASRSALLISVGGVGSGMLIGCIAGAVAGYFRGWVGNVIMRIMDVLFAFPNLLLALMLVTVFGTGTYNVLLAIAIFSIPSFARLMNGFILEAQAYGYVKAARSYNAGHARILFRHMIPAALPKIGVQISMALGTGILTETALSFLGLGVQPPNPSWGGMLNEAQSFMYLAPLYPLIPGVIIFIAVAGFNLVGDGIAARRKEAVS